MTKIDTDQNSSRLLNYNTEPFLNRTAEKLKSLQQTKEPKYFFLKTNHCLEINNKSLINDK